MNTYKLKDIERLYTVGSINRNIEMLIEAVSKSLSETVSEAQPSNDGNELQPHLPRRRSQRKNKEDFTNSVVIVAGNCGMGERSLEYYLDVLGEFNGMLAERNCHVMIVRGHDDDPSYFSEKRIDLSNVKTVPDYSVIELKYLNCLCIGGSVSVDREWKLSQEVEFGKKMYYEDEKPHFDEAAIEEISSAYKIHCVVTSTSPSFAYPGGNTYNNSRWSHGEGTLVDELREERTVLNKIYTKLVDGNQKPYIWLYSRFEKKNANMLDDILFKSLKRNDIVDVCGMIESNFHITINKALGSNTSPSSGMDADDDYDMDEQLSVDTPVELGGDDGAPNGRFRMADNMFAINQGNLGNFMVVDAEQVQAVRRDDIEYHF